MITISQLSIYPIKSIAGNHLDSCEVERIGLQYDRRWALVDENNVAITSRKFPQLLDIRAQIGETNLSIFYQEKLIASTPLESPAAADFSFDIWKQMVNGTSTSPEIDQWFSSFLKIPCRLIFSNQNSHRSMLAKNGGKEGDVLSYADGAPLLVVSEASLADLNSKIGDPIGMERFRPNIVVKGCAAFAEDTWSSFRIGAMEFEVAGSCKRCVLTTIDPKTKEKHPQSEPLRTLATYRPHKNGGVGFGMHVIPRQLGRLSIGDELIFS